MRVLSLLPAATEMVAALGMADTLVGVTHECDHPRVVVAGLPRITSSSIEGETAGEIDRQVREAAGQGVSLFHLRERDILELCPDVLLTQALCDVCAVSEYDVRTIAARMISKPRIVTLSGTTIEGIFGDILRVADALGVSEAGATLITTLRGQLQSVHTQLKVNAAPRPRVAVIEWTDPLYAAGHWVPEMVHRAGGLDVLSTSGAHSTTRTAAEIRAASPDFLCIAPCGYDVTKGGAAATELLARPEWEWARRIPVWVLDGNAFTSRPGPRVVEGVETLAAMLHPALFHPPVPGAAIRIVN